MSKRVKYTHDPEIHSKHLKRQLDSLEKDNHQPLSDVEGLISIALAAQEEDIATTTTTAGASRKSRSRSINAHSTKANLTMLLEEAPVTTYCYQTCAVKPSIYPPRKFCSVCGYQSDYICLRCGMKYCSTVCLSTHRETRCLKWTT
ncbi:zinc finger HIT domain-containing protein 1-like protein [Blakeslea trispora]|nr:zinc finger HIT domain-containing protein 1-like protein [Blakeslea trispora]